MQTFTGIEYVKIDIANQFGLDRLKWRDRMHWVDNNRPDLMSLVDNSQKPLLFQKAIRALEAAETGVPNRHIMGLDATASGLQIMAAMSGCHKTARCVNLINTGNREDVYQEVSVTMSEYMKAEVKREIVKQPVMTFFYGSQAQPRAIFGEGEALTAFYSAMGNLMPGAVELMRLFQSFWNPTTSRYQWAMPDRHVVSWPVMGLKDQGIEIDEADHTRFVYRSKSPQAKVQGRPLAANITHSVDAYVCREMIRRSQKSGFHMVPIHDCFFAHPNDMNEVRQHYIDCMVDIAEQDLVSNILTQISGQPFRYAKQSTDLAEQIRESDYALS